MVDAVPDPFPSRLRQVFAPLRRLGPAIIVAAVVLGPGSLLSASKVGCQFGTSLLWVVVCAAVLMAGTTVTAAAVGCQLRQSPLSELADRLHRVASVVVGLTLFGIVVSFQGSNNAAVLAGLRALLPDGSDQLAAASLTAINGLVIAFLWLGRDLYRIVERLMKWLVATMAIAFAINLIVATPSLRDVGRGLVPSLPDGLAISLWPSGAESNGDPSRPLFALVGTTFSIAAAFYQCYLVRERGWSLDDVAASRTDSLFGIAALGLATSIVLLTAATTLHGVVDPGELSTVQQVAAQLQPSFGRWATGLFSIGILAAAFSSFLGNALIGGTFAADGFGYDSSLRATPQKIATTTALTIGLAIALGTQGGSQVDAIVLLQSLTILGGPILAASLLYLATRPSVETPAWAILLTALGGGVVLLMTIRSTRLFWLRWIDSPLP